jgi:hypothetical protein
MLLLVGRDSIESKIICGIYIVAFSILVEYLTRVVLYLSGFFTIKQSWSPFLLLFISGACVAAALFNFFNYWKLFGVAVMCFVNEKSLTIFLIKLYFLKEEFPLNTSGYQGLADLGLLTMWLYTCLPSSHRDPPAEDVPWTSEQVFSGMLLLGLALGVEWPGSSIESMVTIYMKLMIVLRMLRILRK